MHPVKFMFAKNQMNTCISTPSACSLWVHIPVCFHRVHINLNISWLSPDTVPSPSTGSRTSLLTASYDIFICIIRCYRPAYTMRSTRCATGTAADSRSILSRSFWLVDRSIRHGNIRQQSYLTYLIIDSKPDWPGRFENCALIGCLSLAAKPNRHGPWYQWLRGA